MERGELEGVIAAVVDEARSYLSGLDAEPVLEDAGAVSGIGGALPDEGFGATAALAKLLAGSPAATRSAGPRFFHFVTGGVTPAALGADWLTTLLDQNFDPRVSSAAKRALDRLES